MLASSLLLASSCTGEAIDSTLIALGGWVIVISGILLAISSYGKIKEKCGSVVAIIASVLIVAAGIVLPSILPPVIADIIGGLFFCYFMIKVLGK